MLTFQQKVKNALLVENHKDAQMAQQTMLKSTQLGQDQDGKSQNVQEINFYQEASEDVNQDHLPLHQKDTVILDVDKGASTREKVLANKRSITAKSHDHSCKLIPSLKPSKRCTDAEKKQYLH